MTTEERRLRLILRKLLDEVRRGYWKGKTDLLFLVGREALTTTERRAKALVETASIISYPYDGKAQP